MYIYCIQRNTSRKEYNDIDIVQDMTFIYYHAVNITVLYVINYIWFNLVKNNIKYSIKNKTIYTIIVIVVLKIMLFFYFIYKPKKYYIQD